jgi:hypothetical protein
MLVIVSKFYLFAIVHCIYYIGIVVVPSKQLFRAFSEKDIVFCAWLRLMRTRDHIDTVPQFRLRQCLPQFGSKAFWMSLHGEEDDCILLLGVGPVFREEVEQCPQQSRLVFCRLRLGRVLRPQLQWKGGLPHRGEHPRDLGILQMAVVHCAAFPSSAQQKGSVLKRTQSEDIDYGKAVGGKRSAAVPLSQLDEADAFLRKGGAHEGKFVLFVVACDDVSGA